MCGRASLTASPEEIAEAFGVDAAALGLSPRYNMAPSEAILAVRARPDSGGREALLLSWGLVRPGSEDARPPINLRMERARQGAMRRTLRERRCIVPVTGFYEWRRAGKARQPYNVRRRDGKPFGIAGAWERLESGGRALESCLLLTLPAGEVVAPIHDRMPLMLDPASYDRWLEPSSREPGALFDGLRLLPEELLESYSVAPLVNRAGVEDPRCLEPAASRTLW